MLQHFEELNDPYVDMNEQRQSSNDYLGMMGSPNYRNLMSPISADREYVNRLVYIKHIELSCEG